MKSAVQVTYEAVARDGGAGDFLRMVMSEGQETGGSDDAGVVLLEKGYRKMARVVNSVAEGTRLADSSEDQLVDMEWERVQEVAQQLEKEQEGGKLKGFKFVPDELAVDGAGVVSKWVCHKVARAYTDGQDAIQFNGKSVERQGGALGDAVEAVVGYVASTTGKKVQERTLAVMRGIVCQLMPSLKQSMGGDASSKLFKAYIYSGVSHVSTVVCKALANVVDLGYKVGAHSDASVLRVRSDLSADVVRAIRSVSFTSMPIPTIADYKGDLEVVRSVGVVVSEEERKLAIETAEADGKFWVAAKIAELPVGRFNVLYANAGSMQLREKSIHPVRGVERIPSKYRKMVFGALEVDVKVARFQCMANVVKRIVSDKFGQKAAARLIERTTPVISMLLEDRTTFRSVLTRLIGGAGKGVDAVKVATTAIGYGSKFSINKMMSTVRPLPQQYRKLLGVKDAEMDAIGDAGEKAAWAVLETLRGEVGILAGIYKRYAGKGAESFNAACMREERKFRDTMTLLGIDGLMVHDGFHGHNLGGYTPLEIKAAFTKIGLDVEVSGEQTKKVGVKRMFEVVAYACRLATGSIAIDTAGLRIKSLLPSTPSLRAKTVATLDAFVAVCDAICGQKAERTRTVTLKVYSTTFDGKPKNTSIAAAQATAQARVVLKTAEVAASMV